MIGAYVVAIFIGQLGYCLLLVLARKQETKQTLVKGVGISLIIANWVMGFWAIAWTLRYFLVSTILVGILLIFLIYPNVVLLIYHTPDSSRPLDTALIHAPLRLFLILPLNIVFWHSLFITLGHSWEVGDPTKYDRYQWEGFGVVLGSNLLALLVVTSHHDIIWCVAAVWLNAAQWSRRPKALPVFVTSILFTILLPIALVVSVLWKNLRTHRRSTGPIALPEEEQENHPAPRDDPEVVWG